MKVTAFVELCLDVDAASLADANADIGTAVDVMLSRLDGASVTARAVNVEQAPAPKLDPAALLRDLLERLERVALGGGGVAWDGRAAS